MAHMDTATLFLLLILNAIHKALNCTITTETSTITKQVGDTVTLQWKVERQHGINFQSIECKNQNALIATGTSSSFNVNKFLNDDDLKKRLNLNRIRTTYSIEISSLTKKESSIYECSILCTSDRGHYYTTPIQLNVKNHKTVNEPNIIGGNHTVNGEETKKGDDIQTKTKEKKQLYMWIGIVATFLFVVIIISVIVCFKKKLYKIKKFTPEEKKDSSTHKVTLLNGQKTKTEDFEEAQYADLLTEPQQETYTDLNLKSALWPSHEYEYVKTVRNSKKLDKKSTVVYEYIDPSFQLKLPKHYV